MSTKTTTAAAPRCTSWLPLLALATLVAAYGLFLLPPIYTKMMSLGMDEDSPTSDPQQSMRDTNNVTLEDGGSAGLQRQSLRTLQRRYRSYDYFFSDDHGMYESTDDYDMYDSTEYHEFVRGDDDGDNDDIPYGSGYPFLHNYGPYDLGIRFNKFDWPDGKPDSWRYLRGYDYPLRGEQAERMKADSMAVSIIMPDDYQYRQDRYRSSHEYIKACGGYPSQPGDYHFWEEMEEVVDWMYALKRNVNPNTLFRLPDLWQHMSVAEVAEAGESLVVFCFCT